MEKRVLILSRGFNGGDAITTLNLFSQWPKEQLCCASLIDSEYLIEFKKNYVFGSKEIKYSFPYKYITSPSESRQDIVHSENVRDLRRASRMGRVYETYLRPLLQWCDLYESRFSIHISDEFDSWIRNVNPDFIYTSIGDIPMAEFIIKLHDKYPNIKFVIHGFDDWMSPSYKIWNDSFHRMRAERLLQKILTFSSGRFTSSEMMAKNYLEKYGYSFICFPNPVKIPEPISKIRSSNRVPSITFTGKVGWHNQEAIKDLIIAIKEVRKRGTQIKFDLYTSTPATQLELLIGRMHEFIQIHKPVSNRDIFQILAFSDILYLPININRHTSKFTKYSMSTKMGEYLSSGVPMIYYGPEGIAMTDFLKERRCAQVVTTRNTSILVEAIMRCLKSDTTPLIERGYLVAQKYFNIDIVSNNFYNVLGAI